MRGGLKTGSAVNPSEIDARVDAASVDESVYPAARAAMLDCVLNLLVQPLTTVRLGVLEVDVASTPPARSRPSTAST